MKKSYFIISAVLTLILISAIGCGGKKSLNTLPSSELFRLGQEQFEKEKYLKAITHFQTLVYNYPGESIVDTAQYYLALSYFKNKDYPLANVEFNRLAINYPASSYAEDAIFMKAVCLFEGTPKHSGLDQSDLYTAIKQFEDFIIDFPESNVLAEAQEYLLKARTRLAKKTYESGVVYDRIGTYASAEIYFQKVADEYTDTEYASLATFGLAEMKYKLKEYKVAQEKFSDFTIVFKDSPLVEKANEYMEKSAYKAGEKAMHDKDYAKALEYFEAFKTDFPTSDKLKDAIKKIEELKQMPIESTKESNENS